jgi:hypothetical protein
VLLVRLQRHLLGLLGRQLLDGRVEDLLLDGHVELEIACELFQQGPALLGAASLLDLLEEGFDLTVLLLEQLDGVHGPPPFGDVDIFEQPSRPATARVVPVTSAPAID